MEILNWSLSMSSDLRTGRHCVFNLHVHLVFIAKYRKKVFTKPILDAMYLHFNKVCGDFEVELREFDGGDNHVHLLINYPPKVSVARLVNSLKGVSSRRLRKEFPSLTQCYHKNALWSPSYFAGSCGGAPIEVIRQYIQYQETPN